jgi:hypothetical protein
MTPTRPASLSWFAPILNLLRSASLLVIFMGQWLIQLVGVAMERQLGDGYAPLVLLC